MSEMGENDIFLKHLAKGIQKIKFSSMTVASLILDISKNLKLDHDMTVSLVLKIGTNRSKIG